MDASGKVTPIEDEADVFKFTFTKDGQPYGDVFATVDDDRRLVLYYGDDVAESPDAPTPGIGYNDTWIGFVEDLKSWKTRNGFKGWQLKNQDHLAPDMARRNHMNKKDKLGESYYAMGKKASYSDAIPTIKMVIQHTRQIEEGEQRYRNIAKIFLENQEGERFLAPTTKPGIARVYARHIAEGGKPHDERWSHIGSLCEEYQKMAGFVRATRNHQFNESAQKLVESGIQHYQSLRESLSKMTGHRGYNSYFESWTPPLMEDEADMSSINELFVQETLDPRIESVMPILSKLHKTVAEMKEVDQLSEWADSLLEMEEPEAQDDFASDVEGDDERQSRLEELYDRKFYIESYIDNPEVLEPEELDGMQAELETIDDEISELGGLNEEESLTSNNPIGIPESEEHSPVAQALTRKILTQRTDLLKQYGPVKVMQAIDSAAEFFGDVEEIGGSDMYAYMQYVEKELGSVEEGIVDTLKNVGSKVLDKLGHGSDEELLKKLQKDAGIPASAQHGKPNMAKPNEEEVDESALQASFGIKKYGKDGMRKLQQLGREHASKATVAKAKAEYTSEDLDTDQKRVGQLGPTSKVKNNNIGKLVGANEGALDNVRNRMQSGSMLDRVRAGAYKAPTAAPAAPGKATAPGYDTETGKPLPPEARFDPHTGKPLPGAVAPGVKPPTTPVATRPPLPSAQAAAQPRPARTVADLTAPKPAMGPTELPSDWKFGMAVPSSVWKPGDDPNKNPNNPIIVHMVKVRDAMTKRGYGDTQSLQDKITRASRGQEFDASGYQAWVDESENFEENFINMAPQAVAEGQDDLNAIKRLLGK